jgi:hypothetical protein
VPLRFAIYARGNPTPVLELTATGITYGPIPSANVDINRPAGYRVVKIASAGSGAGGATNPTGPMTAGALAHHEVSGVRAVSAQVPFTLNAPKSLIGLPRRNTSLLDMGGARGALITYGQNLGGIVVIERPAAGSGAGAAGRASNGEVGNLSLPTVSINGVTGQELDTALGTVLTFTRNGVSYTVLGSVPSYAADQAARALTR